MRTVNTAALALSAVALVAAQGNVYTVENITRLGDIDDGRKNSWCIDQRRVCPKLCGSEELTETNQCDSTSLEYDCTCTNGTAPGLAYYLLTLSTNLCLEAYSQCIDDNPGDQRGQDECLEIREQDCDTKTLIDPFKVTSSESPSQSATSSSGPSPTNSANDASQTSEEAEPSASADGDDDNVAAHQAVGPFVGAAALAVAVFAAMF